MPTLYLDNFRGFKETFIPLKEINFFVGENSTGKTSVLKLIKTISDPRFWIMQNFNIENAELGYFSEIVSANSINKKYFDIGILGDTTDKENNISAIKMRFFDNEGAPELREVHLINKNFNIQALISKSGIRYRYSKIDIEKIKENNKNRYFKLWLKENGLKNKRYKEIQIEETFFKQAFLFQLDTIISKEISNINKLSSIKVPNLLKEVAWIAPIRSEPKRTYDKYNITFSPDGTHAPYLLKKLLQNKSNVKDILIKFGEDSGLFTDISIKKLGRSQFSPFELQIGINNRTLKITNVGYGVSQILPLIIEVIARHKNTWFAIQQPEIHLHPKAQAAFGDFIFKSFIKEQKKFIIETHSDYIIDRFRLRLNNNFKNKKNNPKSQIVFFSKTESGNSTSIIEIHDNGSISENQPKEYRDFFVREQLELIKI